MAINFKNLAVALVALGMTSVATADELLVTQQKRGGSYAIALDYVSDGKAAAFDFKISIPGGEEAKVDLSQCAKALPKTHTGACSFAKGQVIGLIYNDTNEPMPAGVHKLGTIYVSTKAEGVPKVTHFLAADASAQKIESKIRDSAE